MDEKRKERRQVSCYLLSSSIPGQLGFYIPGVSMPDVWSGLLVGYTSYGVLAQRSAEATIKRAN